MRPVLALALLPALAMPAFMTATPASAMKSRAAIAACDKRPACKYKIWTGMNGDLIVEILVPDGTIVECWNAQECIVFRAKGKGKGFVVPSGFSILGSHGVASGSADGSGTGGHFVGMGGSVATGVKASTSNPGGGAVSH